MKTSANVFSFFQNKCVFVSLGCASQDQNMHIEKGKKDLLGRGSLHREGYEELKPAGTTTENHMSMTCGIHVFHHILYNNGSKRKANSSEIRSRNLIDVTKGTRAALRAQPLALRISDKRHIKICNAFYVGWNEVNPYENVHL